MLDEAPLVPEAPLRVEPDGALARTPLGRGKAEELGMVTGAHGNPSVDRLAAIFPPRVSSIVPDVSLVRRVSAARIHSPGRGRIDPGEDRGLTSSWRARDRARGSPRDPRSTLLRRSAFGSGRSTCQPLAPNKDSAVRVNSWRDASPLLRRSKKSLVLHVLRVRRRSDRADRSIDDVCRTIDDVARRENCALPNGRRHLPNHLRRRPNDRRRSSNEKLGLSRRRSRLPFVRRRRSLGRFDLPSDESFVLDGPSHSSKQQSRLPEQSTTSA